MRRYWRVLGAVVSGGLINLGVASAFAIWGPSIQAGRAVPREARRGQLDLRTPSTCSVGEWSCSPVGPAYTGTGASMRLGALEERRSGEPVVLSRNYLVNWSAGWPLQSFCGLAVYDNLDRAPLLTEGLLPLPQPLRAEAYSPFAPPGLPIRPIALGFAANTACFSLAAALLLFAPGVVGRYARRCRNRCVMCGYDRRGLAADAKCPECGTVPAP